jgi:hypothetical protein
MKNRIEGNTHIQFPKEPGSQKELRPPGISEPEGSLTLPPGQRLGERDGPSVGNQEFVGEVSKLEINPLQDNKKNVKQDVSREVLILKKILAQFQGQFASVKADIQELKETGKSLQDNIKNVKQDVSGEVQNLEKILTQHINTTNNKISELQGQFDSVKADVQELKKTGKSLQSEIKEAISIALQEQLVASIREAVKKDELDKVITQQPDTGGSTAPPISPPSPPPPSGSDGSPGTAPRNGGNKGPKPTAASKKTELMIGAMVAIAIGVLGLIPATVAVMLSSGWSSLVVAAIASPLLSSFIWQFGIMAIVLAVFFLTIRQDFLYKMIDNILSFIDDQIFDGVFEELRKSFSSLISQQISMMVLVISTSLVALALLPLVFGRPLSLYDVSVNFVVNILGAAVFNLFAYWQNQLLQQQ